MRLIKAARMLSATAMLAALAMTGSAATAAEQKSLPLHQPTPIVAKDFQPQDHEQCPGVPADKDGWHFVIPTDGVEFVELKVTFDPGGEQTITAFGPPTAKHAYATSEPGAELVSAAALVTGEAADLATLEWFNLSHTCPGTPSSTPTPPTSPSPSPTPDTTITPPASPTPSPSDSTTPTTTSTPTTSSSPSAAPSTSDNEVSPAPVANQSGGLPFTGAPTLALAGIAAALLLGGTTAVMVARRRRAAAQD